MSVIQFSVQDAVFVDGRGQIARYPTGYPTRYPTPFWYMDLASVSTSIFSGFQTTGFEMAKIGQVQT